MIYGHKPQPVEIALQVPTISTAIAFRGANSIEEETK